MGIHEDGQGGLWYVQYRANPTEELPSIKHFDKEGNEDFSNTTSSTNSGKMAVTADGKYIALPQGSGKVVVLNCDIEKLTVSPEGRAFISSVIDYVSR